MKTLVLASSLGLILLTNKAVASQNSVWRNIDINTSDVVVEKNVVDTNWRSTQFNPIEKTNKDTKNAKVWRRIRV